MTGTVIPVETPTVYLSEGDVALGPAHELVVAYGRRCGMRGYGGYHPVTPFAIVKDLDAFKEFAEQCQLITLEGAMQLHPTPLED